MYRSALEDSATFLITFNQEVAAGSILNAATLCSKNIFWYIPRQFSCDPAIRAGFQRFIQTLAEGSLDMVADFPRRAKFSQPIIKVSPIAMLRSCILTRTSLW